MSKGSATAFKLFYPLAFFGAHLAFMPLLILLLPRRVALLEPSNPIFYLSLLLLLGGLTASIAHIGAGWWSDRFMQARGSRRVPVAIGLALLVSSYGGLALAGSFGALLIAVICFQIALNILFAPLGALLTDYVHDDSKARATAWLALALPLSTAAAAFIAWTWPRDSTAAFLATAVTSAIFILPLLLFWPNSAVQETSAIEERETAGAAPARDFRLAWLARLLVQCGAALVINYLYIYLGTVPASSALPAPTNRAVAILLILSSLIGAVATIAAGGISDRLSRRRIPIAISGVAVSAGLLLLAARPEWSLILAGYCLFSAGLTVFLAIDSALVATLLGASRERGKWLGIMNLTNTLPAIIIPALALAAVQITASYGVSVLLIIAASGSTVASVLITRVRSVR